MAARSAIANRLAAMYARQGGGYMGGSFMPMVEGSGLFGGYLKRGKDGRLYERRSKSKKTPDGGYGQLTKNYKRLYSFPASQRSNMRAALRFVAGKDGGHRMPSDWNRFVAANIASARASVRRGRRVSGPGSQDANREVMADAMRSLAARWKNASDAYAQAPLPFMGYEGDLGYTTRKRVYKPSGFVRRAPYAKKMKMTY